MPTIKERFQNVARKLTNDVLLRRPLELEQADLQRALASRFPLRREGTVTLQFADPFVRLDCGEDRMGLELSISARLLGAMTPATRWLVIGELKYQRENGWFTLGQPDLHEFTASNRPNGAGRGRRLRGLAAETRSASRGWDRLQGPLLLLGLASGLALASAVARRLARVGRPIEGRLDALFAAPEHDELARPALL